jgi:hypothetical protein
MYQRASTNGLSRRSPGITLDTDELERELGATEEGAELEVVGALELLGALELVVVTDELLGATEELLGAIEELLGVVGTLLDDGATLLDELPTTFKQVERAIQLLLFSHPHPLCVVTHNG